MSIKHTIRRKITVLLLGMVLTALCLTGAVSLWSLYSMHAQSEESSAMLGKTAAEDAELALEELAAENLQTVAWERTACIEEKFAEVEAYVLGIAALAQNIYENPKQYPDRETALPKQDSTELAAQLLWSETRAADEAKIPAFTEEVLKLGNIQDLLVQYNAHNDMVSSTYIATQSGWMIQADYIAYSKYEKSTGETPENTTALPMYYEAAQRQWYRLALEEPSGGVVYTDVIEDIHEGGDCIVCASPVYADGELVAVAGVGFYLETVKEAVLNIAIGESGYAFLVNEKGQILVSGAAQGETAAGTEQGMDLRKSDNAQLASAAVHMTAGDSGCVRLTLDDREVYLAYAPLETLGWSFVTVMDVEEVVASARESENRILALTEEVSESQKATIRTMLVSFVAVMAAVMAFICLSGMTFSKKLTEPIRSLTKTVAQIDGRALDRRVLITTGDEVEELGNAFNKMAEQLQGYISNLKIVTAEKERIRSEIQVASKLQADMLPDAKSAFPNRGEFTLAASMTPAKGVGGDFYDFFLLDENRLALVMADVSGKGVPAALFMVVSRTILKSRLMAATAAEEAGKEDFLAETVADINNLLCANNADGMFVTAWIGIFTVSTGEVTFVNAGHCRPLVCRRDKSCGYDTSFGGFVLAGMEDSVYQQGSIKLRQGDALLLYTDGVTEAANAGKELYGEARLKKTVECHLRQKEEKQTWNQKEPWGLLHAVHQDVDRFQRGTEQADDITLLAVTYYGHGFAECMGKPQIKRLENVVAFVEEQLKSGGISAENTADVQMAVDEIFSNICRYSNATEVTVGVRVQEELKTGEKKAILFFEDDGIPYNPLENMDPDVSAPLEERKAGGLGIYLVKRRMDRTAYRYYDGKNRFEIEKQNRIENKTRT